MHDPHNQPMLSEGIAKVLTARQYDSRCMDLRFNRLRQQLEQDMPEENILPFNSHDSLKSKESALSWWRLAVAASALASALLLTVHLVQHHIQSSIPTRDLPTLETVETLWEVEERLHAISSLLDHDTRADFLMLTMEFNYE